MSHYVHHVPGRLRIRCQSLRTNAQKLKQITNLLTAEDGVYDVEWKKHAGSITVHYHAEMTDQKTILALLEAQGFGLQAKPAAPTRSRKRLGPLSSKALGETVTRTIVGAVVGTLVRHTIEPPVVAVLKSTGVAK